jgi:hypothetical protein
MKAFVRPEAVLLEEGASRGGLVFSFGFPSDLHMPPKLPISRNLAILKLR